MKLLSELAVPVSMALHELTTNALRHGALAHPSGRVAVTWAVEDGAAGRCLSWTWDEHDGPPPALPTREGFGSRLLNKILVAQTAAAVEVAFAADGLRVHVRMPLERRPWAACAREGIAGGKDEGPWLSDRRQPTLHSKPSRGRGLDCGHRRMESRAAV